MQLQLPANYRRSVHRLLPVDYQRSVCRQPAVDCLYHHYFASQPVRSHPRSSRPTLPSQGSSHRKACSLHQFHKIVSEPYNLQLEIIFSPLWQENGYRFPSLHSEVPVPAHPPLPSLPFLLLLFSRYSKVAAAVQKMLQATSLPAFPSDIFHIYFSIFFFDNFYNHENT